MKNSELRGAGSFRGITVRQTAAYAGAVSFLRCLLFSFAFLCCLIGVGALQSLADAPELELSYGYQNTAKAGRLLPLKISIHNPNAQTLSGELRVSMAESESSVYEYRYPLTVEGNSDKRMEEMIALRSGIHQLEVSIRDRQGRELLSRRVGLNVASTDAELIVGVLSDNPDKLDYLNGIELNNGLLRTRLLSLKAEDMPDNEYELDQFDLLIITNFELKQLKTRAVMALRQWNAKGGILCLGIGSRGLNALSPYYTERLAQVQPGMSPNELMMAVHRLGMDDDASGDESPSAVDDIHLSAPDLRFEDAMVLLNDGPVPLLSRIPEGAGNLLMAAFDFGELNRYAQREPALGSRLLELILGQTRLEELSVSASERSLQAFWQVQDMIHVDRERNLPNISLYALALALYCLICGPGLYFLCRSRGALRLYRPGLLCLSVVFLALFWYMGLNTRFDGTFVSYAKIRDISKNNIEETDYINIQSPYYQPYTVPIRTEYTVHPILRGSRFSGEPGSSAATALTSVSYGTAETDIAIRRAAPFSARYFQLNNNIPNDEGSFGGQVSYFEGRLSGELRNNTRYSLSDVLLLLFGKVIKIGALGAGQSIDLSSAEQLSMPIGQPELMAAMVQGGSRSRVISYYLSQSSPMVSEARIFGFVREGAQTFLADPSIDTYGVSMVTGLIPINRTAGRLRSYPILSRSPKIVTGSYIYKDNSIEGSAPVELEYALGETDRIVRLYLADRVLGTQGGGVSAQVPFVGSISLYNRQSGEYDTLAAEMVYMEADELAPYLSEDNRLQLRYVPSFEDALGRRMYLPMIYVTGEVR